MYNIPKTQAAVLSLLRLEMFLTHGSDEENVLLTSPVTQKLKPIVKVQCCFTSTHHKVC